MNYPAEFVGVIAVALAVVAVPFLVLMAVLWRAGIAGRAACAACMLAVADMGTVFFVVKPEPIPAAAEERFVLFFALWGLLLYSGLGAACVLAVIRGFLAGPRAGRR